MNMNPLPTSLPPPPPLSRTASSTSFSSEDDASMSSSTVTVISSSRRTRKRFTNVQLTMLENLFHQNSHPSRDDREAVANGGGMEIKSVTIWFQNKRQTERKASNNNGVGNNSNNNTITSNIVPNITSTMHTFSLHNSQSTSRTASPPFSVSSRTSTATTSSRPSLDRVASRTELRAAAPRTPSRRPTNNTGAIWDNMPSSPLAPPNSPPAREFIDFGKNAKTRRTLEWACAAARLADKDGYASGMSAGLSSADRGSSSSKSKGRTVHRPSERRKSSDSYGADQEMEVTDDEAHEAITPPSTWGRDDRRWTSAHDGSHAHNSITTTAVSSELPKGVEDDDMFKAALALCGLGRRT